MMAMALGLRDGDGDDRFARWRILVEMRWRLNSLISAGGFSAYQMVLGPNPTDLFGWEVSDEDLMFARDTSLAGQFVQQRKLRLRAQEPALKGVANSKLRRPHPFDRSSNCADINFGDRASFAKRRVLKALLVGAPRRKFSTPMKLGRRPPSKARRFRWLVFACART